MQTINSLDNSFIKKISALKTGKARKEQSLYILEGKELVQESLKAGVTLEILICHELFDEDIHRWSIDPSIKIIPCSAKVFKKVSTFETPRGILALNPIPQNKIEDLQIKQNTLILDAIQDPGNMGTILRSSDAFLYSNIILLEGCADPYSPKCSRASMGSILRQKIYFLERKNLKHFKAQNNFQIFGLDLRGDFDMKESKLPNSYSIAIGNESKGLSNELLELLDKRIKINMPGETESLNASVAASIAMYELNHRRLSF